MPFDGKNYTPPADLTTRLGRLMRLQKLLADQNDLDQWSFRTCLWHAASHDKELLKAGLTPEPFENFKARHVAFSYYTDTRILRKAYEEKSPWHSNANPFFGIRDNSRIWSDDTVARKQKQIAKMIEREKAKVLA